jgi:hypothetical protein
MAPLMVTFEQLKNGMIRLEFGNRAQINAIKAEENRLHRENEKCLTCEGVKIIECPECNGEGEIALI